MQILQLPILPTPKASSLERKICLHLKAHRSCVWHSQTSPKTPATRRVFSETFLLLISEALLVLSFIGYLSAGNLGLNLCIEVPIVKLVVEQVALSVIIRWQRTFVSRLPSISHSVQSRLPLLPLLLSRLPLTRPESLHQAARSFKAVLLN